MLGGAGSAGNAWVIGVLAGLRDGGVDATRADRVIGTSAGSTAAAQATSVHATALFTQIVEAPAPAARTAAPPTPGRAAPVDHRARTAAIIDEAHDLADMRRRLGAAALALDGSTDPAVRERWRAVVAARLPSATWPAVDLVVTAVDAHTGDPVLFDRESGVDLIDAVSASCSSGTAYAIGDRMYIDGGYRTNSDNADLAAGYEHVLVLSPFGGRARVPRSWGVHLEDQIAALRSGGSRVEPVLPDDDAIAAFGDDVMDPSRRPPAARAGHAQGLALAPAIAPFWG